MKNEVKAKLAAVLLFCSIALLTSAGAGEFMRTSSFDSVATFTAAAKAFHPADSNTDMARLFTIAERGQPEDRKSGKPVVAKGLDSCEVVWEGRTHAFVFATTTPRTEGTRSAIGVLFLLSQSRRRWIISDLRRFTATGKHAEVTCAFTAGVGEGYQLGESHDHFPAVVTINEHQGGRGYSYQLSASFSREGTHIKQRTLE
jgi:hypothetical protein